MQYALFDARLFPDQWIYTLLVVIKMNIESRLHDMNIVLETFVYRGLGLRQNVFSWKTLHAKNSYFNVQRFAPSS